MAYAIKTFKTPDGPLTLEFDFIPAEPTTAQLAAFVPHVCSTCEFPNSCDKRQNGVIDDCNSWKIGFQAYCAAEIEYYKALHRKHYGKPKYPCDKCSTQDSPNCKKCPLWRAWYLHRQALINAYAEKLAKFWRYYLPGD